MLINFYLVCDCKWKGSILWLNNDNKQKKILNKLNNHEILESLVSRQQQIVSTVYASTDLPPKSIIDWLEYSNVEFLNEQHPLRSQSYYCHMKDTLDASNESIDDLNTSVALGAFVNDYCLNSLFINGSFKFTMLIVIVSSLMLLTTFCLMIALVYNSALRNLITMVDEDFLHHYDYDAFVSYNFNDSDWVLNKLVPSLEEIPDLNNNTQSSKIHFSSIYQENDEKYNLRTWIRNNKNKKSAHRMNQKFEKRPDPKVDNYQPTKCNQKNCDHHHPNEQPNRIKLCVYERDFIAGKQISDCITESIRNSRKVILVVSKNFAQSAWCRFETDLAHHVLVDQNRDGLILIKLEELNTEFLEKTAPQLHFLLKTRIYLQWSEDKKEQLVFWKKLHSALGFNKANNGTYNQIRNMYQNYCTNYKPDLKRRHSVVLAPTQNELNASYAKQETDVDLVNNVISNLVNIDDKAVKLEEAIVKDENVVDKNGLQRIAVQTSANAESSSKDKNEDQIDSRLSEKIDNAMNNQIQIERKLNEDDRIELRNLNHFLNSYGKSD